VTGASAYLHGVGYDFDVWHKELDRAVAHVKAQMQQQ
jgi:hypothetical protein